MLVAANDTGSVNEEPHSLSVMARAISLMTMILMQIPSYALSVSASTNRRHGRLGNSRVNWCALTGTYGQITVNADGIILMSPTKMLRMSSMLAVTDL